ncbi:MAG: tripartite tricarboxylate transporter permease [Kiritimatiellia bacterium]|nr:tripartite tricarboxylate transporter permease [Kiritimatiellia bacterium]
MIWVLAVASALAGTLLSSLLSLLPALHIYNVLGGIVLGGIALQGAGVSLPPEVLLPLVTSLIVGWSMLNTIPSILLGAPDESAVFTVLPGQKYLMTGRGFEGVMMTAIGGLAGAALIVFGIGPLAPVLLPTMRRVLSPHMHWILWVIITFILMTEWPKGGNKGPAGWRKFASAWAGLGVGLATFLLSGFLGFILLYRSPVSVEAAFQNIMPAFVGLFAIPWCLFNWISAASVPPQHVPDTVELDGDLVLRGTAAGGLGGGFAAFFPVITGGVGGLLAGHATAQRDERVFLLSQGVSKLVYYAGAFVLFFVPGLNLRRGGGAWMMQQMVQPRSSYEYFLVLGTVALSAGAAFLLMGPLTRATLGLMRRIPYQHISAFALAVIVTLVYSLTGIPGLAVAAVATGIGSLPVLFGSRRLNCLGILLLPMACNMSGFGIDIARFLGLI